jgi:peptide chain release factor 1
MWDKLRDVEERYEFLAQQLSRSEVVADREIFQKYSKEYKGLTELITVYRSYRKAQEELQGSQELLEASAGDPELRRMADDEARVLAKVMSDLEQQLQVLLLPKDPNDDKNVILEIRAGAGGDEASLFAGELFRMYSRYAETRGWRVEPMSISSAGPGGYKEVIAMIHGDGAYSRLKYERGVHRVQRVPETEAAGRVHTSTVTVAVMPEAEDVEIEINDKDLRIDVYRSSGPGGQSVNTTDSAVRITHLPTGLVVAMQDEKSQHKNKDKAMRVLKARLFELKQAELDAARREDRRSQVGTGDRSEKIRTYNFPQSRITDHRIKHSVHSVNEVMNGDIDQLIDPLVAFFQAEALRGDGDFPSFV